MNLCPLKYKMPQGLALSPKLFNIYMKWLGEAIGVGAVVSLIYG